MKPETVELLVIASGAAFTILLSAALMYARRAALSLAKLASVELRDEQLRQLDAYVAKAVAYVEEQAHKYLRGMVKQAPSTGQEKQELAARIARELAPDGLKHFSDKAVAVVIDAAVQDRRVSLTPIAHLSVPPPSLPPMPALPTPMPPRRSP